MESLAAPCGGCGADDCMLEHGMVADNIRLTEGERRTLCVSVHLPDCMRRLDGMWSLDQFELLDELYRGKTSLLHEVIDKASGTRVAIKQYRKKYLSPLNRYQVEREVAIHIALRHPNIITLHAAFEDPEQVYLVQEFAPGGDLFEALKHQSGMVYEERQAVAHFLAPCLEALAYLHNRGIIHRDIKPENILLGEAGTVKLADFGLAINSSRERPVTRAGTLDYMAPEVLVCPDKKRPDENKDKASLGYNEQVDAWAAGCLAAELVTGSPPFESESRSATYQLIMYREPRLPSRLSDAAKNFISASLVKEPHARATIYQLVQHDWITSNKDAYISAETTAPKKPASTEECHIVAERHGQSNLQQQVTGSELVCSSCWNNTASVEGLNSSSMNGGKNSNSYNNNFGGSRSSSNAPAEAAELAQMKEAGGSSVAAAAVTPGQKGAASVPPSSCCNQQKANGSLSGSSQSGHSSVETTAAGCTVAAVDDAAQPLGTVAQPSRLQLLMQEKAAAAAAAAAAAPAAAAAAAAAASLIPIVAATGASFNKCEAAGEPVQLKRHKRAAAIAAAAATTTQPAVIQVAAPVGLVSTATVDSDSDTEPDVASAPGAGVVVESTAVRQSRASSHHGHRLHKIFYPHDKHRRSSYSNMQWDDWIDTSSHSFSSSSNPAVLPTDDGQPGAAAAAIAAGGSSAAQFSARASCSCGTRGSAQGRDLLSKSAAVAASEVCEGAMGMEVGGSSGRSSSCNGAARGLKQHPQQQLAGSVCQAHHGSMHSAVLAVMPDAGLQAPAAVMSDVLAKTASGALHLLAVNDLEDLIAPTAAPACALNSLGILVGPDGTPILPETGSGASGGSNAGNVSISRSSSSGAALGAAGRGSSRVRAGVLCGNDFDDCIATSATPGGVVVQMGYLISRSSSVSNLSALGSTVHTATPSPPASPTPASVVNSRGRMASGCGHAGHAGHDRAASPGANSAAVAAALLLGTGPDGLSPRPPCTPRSARGNNLGAHLQHGSLAIADATCSNASIATASCSMTPTNGAASPSGPPAKPILRTMKSGVSLSVVLPGSEAAAGVCAGHCTCGSREYGSNSLPLSPPCDVFSHLDDSRAATPSSGSKRVVWADESLPANEIFAASPMRPTSAAAAVASSGDALLPNGRKISLIGYDCGSSSNGSGLQSPRQYLAGFEQHDGQLARSSSQPALTMHHHADRNGKQQQKQQKQKQQQQQKLTRHQQAAASVGAEAALISDSSSRGACSGLQRQPCNYILPPAGVLSSDMGLLAHKSAAGRGPLAIKAAAPAAMPVPRSFSCSLGDLRAAAAGTMGQQPLQASNPLSRDKSSNTGAAVGAAVGQRRTSQTQRSSNGAAETGDAKSGGVSVFESAVPFSAVGTLLGLRNASQSFTSCTQLAASRGGGARTSDPHDSGDDSCLSELMAARQAKSFTAGVPVAAGVGGGRKSGALSPTKATGAALAGHGDMAGAKRKSMPGTSALAWA